MPPGVSGWRHRTPGGRAHPTAERRRAGSSPPSFVISFPGLCCRFSPQGSSTPVSARQHTVPRFAMRHCQRAGRTGERKTAVQGRLPPLRASWMPLKFARDSARRQSHRFECLRSHRLPVQPGWFSRDGAERLAAKRAPVDCNTCSHAESPAQSARFRWRLPARRKHSAARRSRFRACR